MDSIPSTFTNGSSSPGPNSKINFVYKWSYLPAYNYLNFIKYKEMFNKMDQTNIFDRVKGFFL